MKPTLLIFKLIGGYGYLFFLVMPLAQRSDVTLPQADLLLTITQNYDKIKKFGEGVFGQHISFQGLSNMAKTLYNAEGEPVAYISDGLTKAIYLWDGHPVAYLWDYHVYGFNGHHLGWFIDGIVYDPDGKRIGFTSTSCPVPVHKETGKAKKYPLDKPGPRYEAPPLPELSFNPSAEDFEEFLKMGQVFL